MVADFARLMKKQDRLRKVVVNLTDCPGVEDRWIQNLASAIPAQYLQCYDLTVGKT